MLPFDSNIKNVFENVNPIFKNIEASFNDQQFVETVLGLKYLLQMGEPYKMYVLMHTILMWFKIQGKNCERPFLRICHFIPFIEGIYTSELLDKKCKFWISMCLSDVAESVNLENVMRKWKKKPEVIEMFEGMKYLLGINASKIYDQK